MRKIFILIRGVTIPHHILINLVESLYVLIVLKICLYFLFVESFIPYLHNSQKKKKIKELEGKVDVIIVHEMVIFASLCIFREIRIFKFYIFNYTQNSASFLTL